MKNYLEQLGIPLRDPSEVKKGLLVGDKHPNWKGGITPLELRLREYFQANIAPVVRARDGFKCMLCGSKKDLHVHHIVEFKWMVQYILQKHKDLDLNNDIEELYDIITKDEMFNDTNNMITLCRHCHLFVVHGYINRTISSQASKEEGSTTIHNVE